MPAVCPLQPPSPHTLSVFEDICASGRWVPAFIQEETEEEVVEAEGLFKANPVSEEYSERDRKVGEEGGSDTRHTPCLLCLAKVDVEFRKGHLWDGGVERGGGEGGQ